MEPVTFHVPPRDTVIVVPPDNRTVLSVPTQDRTFTVPPRK